MLSYRSYLINAEIATLERQLNDFDRATRIAALAELIARADRGEIALPAASDVVNMHCHTFFSFNAYGYSPAALAWLAKKRGFRVVGIVDFDVLDGADEFLQACDLAGVRGSVGVETRVFVPEFATREINSPGEPGIYYHMGIGFTSSSVPPEAAPILAAMRERAERRNRAMLARLNAHLAPVAVDYDRDVLPLTPAGNATERHMLQAIIRAVDEWANGRMGESANGRISESANHESRITDHGVRSTQYT
ncbi:MAG: PHP domain-containing protein, partial [Anaerolineae bacterium]|nr:PHP domain-containing protein [Anaerolineae bacterium]